MILFQKCTIVDIFTEILDHGKDKPSDTKHSQGTKASIDNNNEVEEESESITGYFNWYFSLFYFSLLIIKFLNTHAYR